MIAWLAENLETHPSIVAQIKAYMLCSWLHLLARKATVIAIEPQPYATRRLQLRAAYNGFRNITIVQAAVSDSPGVAEFHIFDEPVSAGLKKSGGQAISVETISIDSLVKKAGVAKIAFIRLDVEGAEQDALTGAQNVIKKDAPLVREDKNDCSDQWAKP